MFIGPSEIGGVTCGHYAFRQDGLDWQVWIQMGDYPLPRKLVLTTMTDEARPQYVATFTWNLAPSFNDAAFTFVPPKGAGRVVLERTQEVGACHDDEDEDSRPSRACFALRSRSSWRWPHRRVGAGAARSRQRAKLVALVREHRTPGGNVNRNTNVNRT